MKKILRLSIWIIGSLLLSFQTACILEEDDSDSECNYVLCTEQFVTIMVSIEDQNQNPISLDSFEAIDMVSGADLTIPLSPSALTRIQERGIYPMVSDMSGIERNQELHVQFRGFINGEEVISAIYTVGADCCHVFLISGDLQLVLELE
ncbi:hypothetical protein [Leptobacterium sp. I13]|uniref:hypothetical protein n=1 Tax=Leptobacterium meishanense TaxID=3128904 RepID=UPI0030EBBE73